jgi:hypothetical protein
MAYGPFQDAVENPAGARPSKCIIIILILTRKPRLIITGGSRVIPHIVILILIRIAGMSRLLATECL